jgi:macrolide transport system ATP-binding/permease protein
VNRLRARLTRLAVFLSAKRRGHAEHTFDDELESHLQLHIDDNLRAGMTLEEARRTAIIKLGGIESTRQKYREQTTVPVLEHLTQDLMFAGRQLRRSPGFTATAIGTLALGTAAALSIFAFVDAALVRPLPYANPERLVSATESTAEIPHAALSYPDYFDWKRLNTVFSAFEAHTGGGVSLTTPSGLELVPIARVTAGFFRSLGVIPALGRDFVEEESKPGAPRTVILSHAAWRTRFGGSPDVIGRTLRLSDEVATIVGVLPASFHFAPRGRPEFWMPFQATSGCDLRRSCHSMLGVARLKDGVTIEGARAQIAGIALALERQYPDSNRGQGASLLPLIESIIGDLRPTLLTVVGGATLLLALAWVNVIGLLLVRSEGRRRELGVRSALGASTVRLVRQLFTEAVVLVGASTACGLLLTLLVVRLLSRLMSDDMLDRLPFLAGVGIGTRVLAAAVLLAGVATILFAVVPTVRLRFGDLREGLTQGARGSSGTTWKRLGFRLVVLELATAMVLLVGASLLGQSLYRLLTVDLGFEPDRLATIQVAAVGPRFEGEERAIRLGREVEARVATLPGVQAVGIASVLPVSFNGNTDWIRIVGRSWDGRHIEVNMREVSAGYFTAIRTRLLRGRVFAATDIAGRPKVALINRTLAAMHFANQNPIGQRFGDRELTPDSIKEIVGVVDDIREGPLDAEVWPAVYYPFEQSPGTFFAVLARTMQDERAILPSLDAAIRAIDPELGTRNGALMRDRIKDSPVAYLRRSSTWLVGGFAGLALLLSIIGLYGVVAYSVGQRTREIGLRVAMGAERGAVYRLILGEAGRLIAFGVVLGGAAAIASARLMQTLLGTTAWDLPTLAAVGAVLAAAAMVASYLPARRAASVNPIDALRVE